MQNNYPIKINPIIAIAVVFQIVFFVFAIVSINQLLTPNNELATIKVDDYSSMDNSISIEVSSSDEISDEHKKIINQTIYDIVSRNNPGNLKNSGAKIRDGSVSSTYLDEMGMYYSRFIVDLEDLKQSYGVIYRWVKDSPRNLDLNDIPLAIAYCLKESDLTYGNFDCKDDYGNKAEAKIIYETMYNHPFQHSTINLIGNPSAGEELSIGIRTSSNIKEDISKAKEEVSNYLSSLGFNLEDYKYAISDCGLCLPED